MKLQNIGKSIGSKLKVFIVILSCLLMSSCSSDSELGMDDIVEHADTIAVASAKHIEREFPILVFSGLGGALNEDKSIHHETLIFTTKERLTKDEGVVIIAGILKVCLENLYADKKMKNYLERYPFRHNNLLVKLFVRHKDGSKPYHPHIGFFTLRDGIMSYRTVIESDEGYFQEEAYWEEPYEVAAKRLGIWDGE